MTIDSIYFTVNFPSDFLHDPSGMNASTKPTWIVPVAGSVIGQGLYKATQLSINVALESQRATSMEEIQQKAKEIVKSLFNPDINIDFNIK